MTRPARISEFYDAEVCLSGDQGDLDITARFTIEGEYHGGRDKCVAIDTEWLSAQWGGPIITRDMAEQVCGKDYLARIEESVGAQYVAEFHPECAA